MERVDCRSEGITNDEACLAYCDFKLDSWAMMNYTDGSFSSCECMDEAKWETVDVDKYDTGVGETIFACDVEHKTVAVNISMN